MTLFYHITIILSVLVMAAAVVLAVHMYRHPKAGKRVFTGLHLLTAGAFAACVLIHLPFYYAAFDFNDAYAFIRPVLLSVHSSLQAFVLGFNFMDIVSTMQSHMLNPGLNAVYTCWIAVLYIFAPLLTLTNIMSLFRNLWSEWRIRLNRSKPLYVFSEMNEKSLAMAQSIAETENKRMLVFTDVYLNNEETNQELMQRALDLRAIAISKDITRVRLKKRDYPISFFLIGDDESENIEQAIRLNEDNRQYVNRSVYIYSAKPGAGYVADSIDKGENTISAKTRKAIMENPEGFLKGAVADKDKQNYDFENSYYIRRIDSIDASVRSTLYDESLMQPLTQMIQENKTISIFIAGLGLHGETFLRNALWMYQIYGFRLSICAVDRLSREALQKRLRKQIPDIAACCVKTGDGSLRYFCDTDGEMRFDVRIYPDTDCETADLTDFFQSRRNDEVFRQTQLVFVTLGDDDRDIETAVTLRRLFDRVNRVNEKLVKANENEPPLIYSVVYDDRKAMNLNCGDGIVGIKNYKGTPYHIHFIGKRSDQYDYKNLIELKKTENTALGCHFSWIQNAEMLRDYYSGSHPELPEEPLKVFKDTMRTYFDKHCGGIVKWGDEFLFPDGKLSAAEILRSVYDYVSYEYYRESSIAKSIHKQMLKKYFAAHFDAYDVNRKHFDSEICQCPRCRNLRVTEHMRWNAFLRINGYIYDPVRRDRAMTHNDLTIWQALAEPEKYKD